MEWHHIISEQPTCLFGQAIDNYVKHPLAKLVQRSDGSWDWIVFNSNMSGNETSRTSARIAADKAMKIDIMSNDRLYDGEEIKKRRKL